MMCALFFSIGIGYLVGSIPFGLILTRLAGLGDIRKTVRATSVPQMCCARDAKTWRLPP